MPRPQNTFKTFCTDDMYVLGFMGVVLGAGGTDMSAVLVAVTVVGFVVFIMLATILAKTWGKYAAKTDENMQWLADTLELSLVGGDPVVPNSRLLRSIRRPVRVEGKRRGCDVSIYHHVTGGRNNTTYARIKVATENPAGLKLAFSRESVLGRVGKSLGMQDVQVGDEHFDRLFLVKCSNPEFIKTALLPEIRERLCKVWEAHKSQGTIKLEDDALIYDELGTIHSEATRNRIAAAAELMCDLGGIVQFYNRQLGA